MELKNLTPDQRAELKRQLDAEIAAEQSARQNEIDTYKSLADQTVHDTFPKLRALAEILKRVKQEVRADFATIIDLKGELYGVKEGQQSHQFISEDGTQRIRIGYNVLDNYDDTVEAGIAIVKEHVQSLARDVESQQLVDMLLDLLAKDGKGTLKASKVLRLRKYADKSGNARFIEGVKIIMDAYKPLESKSYVKAEYKDAAGTWISIPGGLTEA